jgi:hypothetical protein
MISVLDVLANNFGGVSWADHGEFIIISVWGCSSMVEYLSRICEAPGSIQTITKISNK